VIVLGVALAGALGAPARFAVESFARRLHGDGFPFGTLIVNASGSLLLGIVVGLAASGTLDPDARTLLAIGFLGAYTTFSTYAYETVRLAEHGASRAAVVYAIGSVLIAGAAAASGLAVTGAL
jgi:fluoride exporter